MNVFSQLHNAPFYSCRLLSSRITTPNPKSNVSFRLTFPSAATPAATLSTSDLSADINKPVVVVGSANADIYVEIDRLPKEGETVAARDGQTLPGGKGANQACCGGRLEHPTYFVGQIGDDAHGRLIEDALRGGGVRLDRLARVFAVPTGFAVVMLKPDGQNSIIIVGGANMKGWPEKVRREDLEMVVSAGVVLLQREIPDRINIQFAEAAKNAGVPVILDAGGVEGPIPVDLLKAVDIFSPNESELGRLTGMPTENFEEATRAVMRCHEMGVNKVLLKLGSKGSALFIEGEKAIRQAAILASEVVDTTGAGDTFTAAFAVALVEGMNLKGCMEFAAAAASLCVEVKGALASMPNRTAVLERLQSVNAKGHHAYY